MNACQIRSLSAIAMIGAVTLSLVACSNGTEPSSESVTPGVVASSGGVASSADGQDLAYSRDEKQLLARHECLVEEGWDVKVSLYDQSLEIDVPAGQQEAWERAHSKCYEKYPPLHKELSEWTDDDYVRMYEEELESKKCLEALDIEISEPPSFEVWKEQIATTNFDQWHAHNDLPSVSSSEYESILSQCPYPELP